jgi:SAM-dependent methyltransferase
MPAGSGDRWPHDYEHGRPGWPRSAVELPELTKSATVLDLGAGTGKLTRVLASEYDRVIAVEPADAMRYLLERICPQVQAVAGHSRDIPLPDSSVEAVFAAEAFHWFDDDQSLAEIARVLRPGGALVLLWNLPAGEWEPPIAAVETCLRERLPDSAVEHDPLDLGGLRRGDGKWRAAFVATGFDPLQDMRILNPQTLDRDGLVAFFASMGWIADMTDEQRLPLLDQVRSLLTASKYRRRWVTHRYWTRLQLH